LAPGLVARNFLFFLCLARGKQTQARQSVSDYNCQPRHDYRNIDIDMWRFHILAAPQTRQDGHNMPSNADKQSHP
jgi:hypothetical protein